ncbi:MAG TPA: transporter [Allosphingosinicella sp.]
MRAGGRALVLAAAIGWSSPAFAAEDLRDLCPDRPGLDTPACTLDPGHFQIEIGVADWTRNRQPDARTDTVLLGELLVRVGVADHSEVQFGWTAYGHVRARDRLSGLVDRQSGTGDVTVALRRNILSPDGSGTALAVMPYAAIPTGGRAIGAGGWSAGLRVPFGFSLSRGLSIAFTPDVEAAANADGHGRHLA